MANITDIQWADTTVNPISGCGGCELFPKPNEILEAVNIAVAKTGHKIDGGAIYKGLVTDCFSKIKEPLPGHKNAVNTTNIWHLRDRFADEIKRVYGNEAAAAAAGAIRLALTCYAATLHLNRGLSIVKPAREPKKGYAPIFEMVTKFKGRVVESAKLRDLLGQSDPGCPWKGTLPRLIFVSDMGDALSSKGDFPFLKSDVMPAIRSEKGQRHLWLWLTKRPDRMAEFADEIGGFPANVCAMTTVTGPDKLERIGQLRQVNASMRGLSIEPLWERIPPRKLNLKGIDWVIVGGESGSLKWSRPFALEWAEELREHCNRHDVAFFLKQLGRNPSRDGVVFRINDKHGGDWDEWDESLRTREFPRAFHQYRQEAMVISSKLRRSRSGQESMDETEFPLTAKEKADFKRLDKIVRQGVAAFIEAGRALREIHDGRLWRAGEYTTWESYCREVAGMSKSYVHRLIQASEIAIELSESLPIGNDSAQLKPVSEAQVRPLARLPEVGQRARAWSVSVEKAQGSSPTAVEVTEAVLEILNPEGVAEKPESRSAQRVNVASRLREAIRGRVPWDQLEQLLEELERLL